MKNIKTGDGSMKNICFLDMDGVVANFAKQANSLLGVKSEGFKNLSRKQMSAWQIGARNKLFYFCDYSDTFWSTMPVMPRVRGSYGLYDYCSSHFDEVKFLSAFRPPEENPERLDVVRKLKTDWVARIFGEDAAKNVIVTSQRKESFIEPGVRCVLVDDMKSNINCWIKNGGIGVLYSEKVKSFSQLFKQCIQIAKEKERD